jgi:hypothetical protein
MGVSARVMLNAIADGQKGNFLLKKRSRLRNKNNIFLFPILHKASCRHQKSLGFNRTQGFFTSRKVYNKKEFC